ncbi:MAG: GNAT family N-acetyltransferase [Candidatus Marinimicrobia bacterium]|nr:GNAT family N-acetyltransferase [Candidatus Neomarinimicrobiota bacterium]
MIKVIKFKNDRKDDWNNFVSISNNGTIFHERKFINYHPKDRFKDHSLFFKKREKIVGLLPAVEYEEAGMKILHSHKGASYGGIVYPCDQSIKKGFDIVEGLLQYAEKENFNKIILTPPPVIYNKKMTNYIEFALIKNNFSYLKREISSILLLENTIEENVKKFKQTSRTAFRKAEKKGIEIRRSNDYKKFYNILKSNLKIRHNVQPTHSLEELKKIVKIYPNRIRLYGAFLENTMVAGTVMFDVNPLVTLAFYISHDEKYQEFRAVNLLFKEIIEDSIKRKFKYLDYGIFTVNMEPNFGLARFKESFGANGIFRDTFTIDI